MFGALMLLISAVAAIVATAVLVMWSRPPAPPPAVGDPRMSAAEACPINALNYACDLFEAYGDAHDAMTFLYQWRLGDLSEAQQYRDYVVAGGFSA